MEAAVSVVDENPESVAVDVPGIGGDSMDVDAEPDPETEQLLDELRIELVKAVNSAQLSSSVEEKQSFLTQAKEIVFHRDPTNNRECRLLKEFVTDICDFVNDERVTMKLFIVDFFEESCKSCGSVIPTVLPKLMSVIDDEADGNNASLLKRAVIVTNNLYRPALTYVCEEASKEQQEDKEKESKLLIVRDTLDLMRKKTLELMKSKHLAVRMASVRVLQTIALSFLAQDPSGPVTISGRLDNIRTTTGPDAFTLMTIPRGQNILLPAQLETDGKGIVQDLLAAFKEINKNRESEEVFRVFLVNTLTVLALHRPVVREKVMDALLEKGEALKSTTDSLRFAQALKANLFPLLKVDAMNGWAKRIESVLKKLGAETTLIGAAKKVAERQTRSKKRARDEEESRTMISKKLHAGVPDIMLIEPELPAISPSQALDFRKMAIERIINSTSTSMNSPFVNLMLARITCDFIPPRTAAQTGRKGSKRKRTEDETKEEHKVDEFTKLVDLRLALIEHIGEDPSSHIDLIQALLFLEFGYDAASNLKISGKRTLRKFTRYDNIFASLLEKLRKNARQNKAAYIQLLTKSPRLPSQALQEVYRFCLNQTEGSLGFRILRDLIAFKPALREICIKALVFFAAHKEEALRRAASSLIIARAYPENSDMRDMIKTYGKRIMESLIAPSQSDQVEDEIAEETGIKEAMEVQENEENAEEDDLDGDITGLVARKLSLFLALCTVKENIDENIMTELLKLYANVNEPIKQAILSLENMNRLINKLGDEMGSSAALKLFMPFDEQAESLVVHVVEQLSKKITDATSASEFVSAVIEATCPGGQLLAGKTEFILPICGFLETEDLYAFMPTVLQLDDAKIKRSVVNVLLGHQAVGIESSDERFASAKQFLIAIITEDSVPSERRLLASQYCLELSQFYPRDTLKELIEDLINEESIPALTMEMVLQCLEKDPGLKSFVVEVLTKLRQRQVWTMEKEVWHGFILCANKLKTNGFPVFLLLPAQELKYALNYLREAEDIDLRPKLQYYYKLNKDKLSNVPEELVSVLTSER